MRDFTIHLARAARRLLRERGLTTTAIVTLALGIGVTVAALVAVRDILLRPLPYPQSQRLVMLWAELRARDIPRVSHSGGDFRTYQREARQFAGIAAVGSVRQNLAAGGVVTQVQTGWISENFFEVMGVDPVKGRDFSPGEDPHSLILSNGFWRERLGGRDDVVGSVIHLDEEPYTVVGVLPPRFALRLAANAGIATDFDVWRPADPVGAPQRWRNQEVEFSTLRVIGRLLPNATLEQASADMQRVARHLRSVYPDHREVDFRIHVVPLLEDVVGHVRESLLLLAGSASGVLLVAALNVGSLLLVRRQRRMRETAVLMTLGARRVDLMTRLLAEALILGAASGLAGIGVASGMLHVILGLAPSSLPRAGSIHLDPIAAGLTLLAGVIVALVLTLPTALGSFSVRPGDLQQRGEGGIRHAKPMKIFVVLELALSLALVSSGGLLLRSLLRLESVDPGFRPKGVLTFSISLPGKRYEAPAGTAAFLDRLQQRLCAIPGVTDAAVVWPLPLEGQIWYGPYEVPGKVRHQDLVLADHRLISSNWPEAAAIPLIAGRSLRPEETRTVLVDRTFAEKNWGLANAIGQHVRAAPVQEMEDFEVVGVLENIHQADLKAPGRETICFGTRGWSWSDFEIFVVVRSSIPPAALVKPVRGALAGIDPQIPLAKVRSFESYVDDSVTLNRFILTLVALLAFCSLLIAGVGIFGTVSYVLAHRTHELGVRMALGSDRRGIERMVVLEALHLVVPGILFGAALGWIVAGLFSSVLFTVGRGDPFSYGAAVVVLTAVAIAAAYLPARRASMMEPSAILRGS